MSEDLNFIVIIGRITRDVELKYSSGGMAILSGSIASNRRIKKGDQWEDKVSFFDFKIFGKSGESIGQYLVKGKLIAISGSLNQDRWEKDGQTHSRVEILAEHIQLLGEGDRKESVPAQFRAPVDIQDQTVPFADDIPF